LAWNLSAWQNLYYKQKPETALQGVRSLALFRRCACKDPAHQRDFLHPMAQARVRFAQDVVNQPVWLFQIQSG